MTNEIRVAHQHLGNISESGRPVAPWRFRRSRSPNWASPGSTPRRVGRPSVSPSTSRSSAINDTYQFQNTLTWVPGNHAVKSGVDFRHMYVKSWFVPTVRGRLFYPTLQRYVDDVAEVGDHQQAAARRAGNQLLRMERSVPVRPGRVAREARPDAVPGVAIRDSLATRSAA